MLLALAAAFAVINGVNDGGAMVASTLRVPGQRVLASVVTFGVALAVIPLVLGTGVATTLTSGLVDAPADARPALIAAGVIAAIGVVGLLTRAGLPTSLTLAMVGGIIGAGVGRGMPVVGPGVARVMIIGLAAPFVGAVLAQALTRATRVVLVRGGPRGMAALSRTSMIAQAVAYGANDGQKMLALVAVTAAGVTPPLVVAVAVLFVVGAIPGIVVAAGTLGRRIAAAGPHEEVTAQLGGSIAVLTSAGFGVPVSMTQAVAGGLVGTGLVRGLRRVRWRVAGQLGVAWLLTLPSAALAGFLIVVVWRGVT